MKNSKLRRILLLLACAVLLVSLSVGATLAYLTSTTQTVTNTFTVGKVEIKLDEAEVNKETGKKVGTSRTETGNTEVRMVPGRLIDKDPTVTVLAGSEDCYVRVKVIVDVSGCTTVNWDATISGDETNGEGQPTKTNLDILADTFVEKYIRYKKAEDEEALGFNTANWNVGATPMIDSKNKTVTYVLTYMDNGTKNIVKKNMDSNTGLPVDTVLPAVFTHIHVPAKLDKDDLAKLAGMKIKVVAEAIQAEGFTASDDKSAEVKAWEAFEDN